MLEIDEHNIELINAVEKGFNLKVLFTYISGGRQLGVSRINSDIDIAWFFIPKISNCLNEGYIVLHTKNCDSRGTNIYSFLQKYQEFVTNYNLGKSFSSAELYDQYLLFAIINSKILYSSKDFANQIKPILNEIFYNKTALEFYLDKARLNSSGIFKADDISKKNMQMRLTLYTLRNVLSCMWIIKNNCIPPNSLPELLSINEDNYINDAANNLMERYCACDSHLTTTPVDIRLIDYLNKNIEFIHEYNKKLPLKTDFNWDLIDEIKRIANNCLRD